MKTITSKIFNKTIISLVISIVVICVQNIASTDEYFKITKLKDMFIETILVKDGRAEVVIIGPHNSRYKEYEDLIQSKIKLISNVDIPFYEDDVLPKNILKSKNVIVLGNMATNRFIEELYRQWYCIIDLKYPGKNGYALRTIHNPYGTGHNVILIGGSDDEGVKDAANRFFEYLKTGSLLKVGWIMDIKIAQNYEVPQIDVQKYPWTVFSWQDSWRRTSNGQTTGYSPSTYFGWNPISVAGVLYYMTGKKEYLDSFKAMIRPDPNNIPKPNLKDDAFKDPIDPLVKNDHYRSHLVDIIYDLIEESPLLTDEERLFITNKLLQHQLKYDANSTFSASNGDRHSLWHMMCIYTGSRYFSYYYPSPIWDKRIENARKGFNSFLGNPTWASNDTLDWISTGYEPIIDFFTMDGADTFLKSGTARTMMSALEILMTGDDIDDYNRFVSINLLHKAAYLLKDSRYIWMARRNGFDIDVFRIGQSYWPEELSEITPPSDLSNQILYYSTPRKNWIEAKSETSVSESFQILSFRTGVTNKDDYLIMDGFYGPGRNTYHLNTIYKLRLFNGRMVLDGYENDVDILYNGMATSKVARAAAIKQAFVKEDLIFLKTEVPDMTNALWERYSLSIKNESYIVLDRITPTEDGIYDIIRTWKTAGNIKEFKSESNTLITDNGIQLSNDNIPFKKITNNIVSENMHNILHKNKSVMFPVIITDTNHISTIKRIDNYYFLTNDSIKAMIGVGDYRSDLISINADYFYLKNDEIMISNLKTFITLNEIIIKSDQPVTCYWNLKEQHLIIISSKSVHLNLTAANHEQMYDLTQGEHIFVDFYPSIKVRMFLTDLLTSLEQMKISNNNDYKNIYENKVNWLPLWEIDLTKQKPSIIVSEHPISEIIWVASSDKQSSAIFRMTSKGTISGKWDVPGEISTLWPAKSKSQAKEFAILAGFKDDTIMAISKEGKIVWSDKINIHSTFKIGEHYDAPWFTDPNPPYNMRGVYSILVGKIFNKTSEEIVIGRPSTVEFRTLRGKFLASTPTHWGNNTTIELLKGFGKNDEDIILVGKTFTGEPTITGINNKFKNISDYLFAGLLPEFTNMQAWLQRGLKHLIVKDINRDGTDEVIYTLSGHWNEIRVYNGLTGSPSWLKYFGPGEAVGDFMQGLAVFDINNDGIDEIIVATKNGWVFCFNDKGNLLWQHFSNHSITSFSFNNARGIIVIGHENGSLITLNKTGEIVNYGEMLYPIKNILCTDNIAYIFDKNGSFRAYTIQ